MNEERLKELYNEEIENSAPDMDALWSRIESGLAEKSSPVSADTDSKPAQRKKPVITLKKAMTFAAACAVLAIVIPAARITNTKSMDSSPSGAGASENFAAADNAAAEKAPAAEYMHEASEDAASDAENAYNGILSYGELALAPTDGVQIRGSGESGGGDYFVEENVLVETEYFIDAIVDKVYASADGSSVCYMLSASNVYYTDGTSAGDVTMIVSSNTKYGMLAGREYLIPVKESEDGLRTVFDGVPQIELTEDGGMVFYNGWKTLDGENARGLLYPQSGIDDFFYDRMKFSYGDYSGLINRWRKLKSSEE